jgi:hypothetical protein
VIAIAVIAAVITVAVIATVIATVIPAAVIIIDALNGRRCHRLIE